MTCTLRQLLVSVLAVLTLGAGCSRSDPPPPEIEEPAVVTTTTAPAPVIENPQLPTEPVENQAEAEEIVDPEPPGDEETSQITVRTRSASLDYQPGADGFSFANFGGGEAPADLTVNMARRLYGDAQVCAEVVDNQCTPYPVILQLIAQANRSMRGGLCEGLTVLSLRLAADPAVLAAYQGTKTVAELVKEDPALLSELAYWYVTQFATEVQEQASAFLELSPIRLAQVLLKDFADAEAGKGATGYTIGIYSEQGGHAVTPYRVEQIEDQYRIYIYDSNWPTSERWIDVDEDGWTYALAATNPTEEAAAWGGSTGTMELTPMTARNGPFSCGFCPVDDESGAGTMLTVAGAGDKQMAIKVETEAGQRLGYYEGEFVNEIPGATYRYLISGPATADPVLVFLPPGIDDFSADVGVVDVPAPVGAGDADVDATASGSLSTDTELGETPPGQEQEEANTQQFSLLVLDEERSVQIDAAVELAPVEEEPPSPGEVPEDEPGDEEPTREALLSFTEEAVQVGDIEEAVVEIAVEAVAIEIELDQGQQIEVVFSTEPAEPVETGPGEEPTPTPAPEAQTLSIEITAETGQSLAEVSIEVQDHVRVDAPASDVSPPGDEPGEELPQPTPPQAVQIEITYDEELGQVAQVEDEIDAWVASDAEYFRAVADGRVDEVLGDAYVEELEEREEWAPLVEDDDLGPLIEVIQDLADDYWEDEHWEEVDYDEEWFEEELAEESLFTGEVDEEWWLDEEELEGWLDEEVPFVDVAWEAGDPGETEVTIEVWDDLLEAGAPARAEIEEQHILDEMGLEEWDEELMGPPPTETVGWTEEEWEIFDDEQGWCDDCDAGPGDNETDPDELGWQDDAEQQALGEDEDVEEEEEAPPPEDDDGPGDPEEEPGTDPSEEPESETAPGDDADPIGDEGDPDGPSGADGGAGDGNSWTGADEEAAILAEEGLTEWPEEWGLSPAETWDWTDEDWEGWEADQVVGIDDTEVDDTEVDELDDTELDDTELDELDELDMDDPEDWPGDDEEAPVCDDGWCEDEPAPEPDPEPAPEPDPEPAPEPDPVDPREGDPPPGYATWGDYEQETAAGITGGDDLPTFVVVADYLPPPPPPPPPQEVYIPTVEYTYSDVAISETISTATETVTTGTATTTEVTTSLTNNSHDGYWYEAVATATTVTDTLVDTTTVVARTGSDMTTCMFLDGVQHGCNTVRGWGPETTTSTDGDAYTSEATTVANSTIPASCSQGGWTGLGDWCIVDSTSRTDYDHVAFELDEATDIRIDADTNLTYAQFVAGNHQFGDPYIYLNHDTDSDTGEHSGDTTEITVGNLIAFDDDGGRDCSPISACINPASDATDPDEFPNSVIAWDDGPTPVIVNVSDVWDSRIEETLAPGDYVVRSSVYSAGHNGWYRLTIREDD